MIDARVSTLPAAARTLIDLLAVAGRPLAVTVLSRAADLDREAAEWTPLWHHRMIRRAGSGHEPQVELFHQGLREWLLRRQDDRQRVAHHLALATTLEQQGTAAPDLLAEHYAEAGEKEKAARYLLRAAEGAISVLAFERGAEHYRRALQLFPGRPSVELALAEALVNAGRGVDAAEVFLRVAERAAPETALELRRKAGLHLLRGGEVERGLALLEQVLEAIGLALPGPREALVQLLALRTRVRLRGLGFREAEPSQLPPEQLQRVDICWSVGASGLGWVNTIAAATYQMRNLLWSLDLGDPYRVARAIAGEIAYSAVGGSNNARRTRRLLIQGAAIAERIDDTHARGMVEMGGGIAAVLEGEFSKGEQRCRRAEELLRQCPGSLFDVTNCQIFSLIAQVYRGRMLEVAVRLPQLLREACALDNRFTAVLLDCSPAHLHWLVVDQPVHLEERLAAATATWSMTGFQVLRCWSLISSINGALYRGDARKASRQLHQSWGDLAPFRRMQFSSIELHQLRARCLLAGNSTSPQLTRSIRRLETSGAQWGAALAALLRAARQAQLGNHARALERIADAIARLDMAGLELYGAAARWRRAQLLGGEAGRRSLDRARRWLIERGVVDPERLVTLLAPGFGQLGRSGP